MSLTFDQEQLAAALERVVFDQEQVDAAITEARSEGAAYAGTFPQQGQAQHQVHALLVLKDGNAFLSVVVFDNDIPAGQPMPPFSVVLKTAGGQVLNSEPHPGAEGDGHAVLIPLSDPQAELIGAQLELVA
jgi:hypothetical protein